MTQAPFSPTGAPFPPSPKPTPASIEPAGDDGPIKVPVPRGQVDLLDPAVVAEEVERGKEENKAEYGK